MTVLKSELEDYLRTRRAKKEIKQLLKENTHSKEETQQESIACPIKGNVIELEEVGDEAFSGGMLGEGFAINPEEGKLYAPVDGIIAAVFRTKHALAMDCLLYPSDAADEEDRGDIGGGRGVKKKKETRKRE